MFEPRWDRNICIKCLVCIKACPRNALREYNGAPTRAKYDPKENNSCTGCGFCSQKCPANAIYQEILPEKSWGNWCPEIEKQLQHIAATGRHLIEGEGTARNIKTFDGLVFIPAQLNKKPLLTKEEVNTSIIIGKKAKKSIKIRTPIMIAAMSFGALSKEAKIALAIAASNTGTIANTGEGGMLKEERKAAKILTLQYSTGRFGINNKTLKQADMIEIKIGQGAKPGLGGHLLANKITHEIAKVRGIGAKGSKYKIGEDVISPSRHVDINNKKDLKKKVDELRKITNGVPIALKIAAGDIEKDLDIAIYANPDVIVVDGMEGGTGAAPLTAKDHAGIPLIHALPRAVEIMKKKKAYGKITLISSGGLRHAPDIAKALALGANGVQIGTIMKTAIGCINCRSCERDTCPVGVCTQNPNLRKNFDIKKEAEHATNTINGLTDELKMIARMIGKNEISKINKNDLATLDELTSKITKVKMC